MRWTRSSTSRSDGGGKDVFELHPSIATAPMDKDFAKAGGKRVPVEGKDFTISATATW